MVDHLPSVAEVLSKSIASEEPLQLAPILQAAMSQETRSTPCPERAMNNGLLVTQLHVKRSTDAQQLRAEENRALRGFEHILIGDLGWRGQHPQTKNNLSKSGLNFKKIEVERNALVLSSIVVHGVLPRVISPEKMPELLEMMESRAYEVRSRELDDDGRSAAEDAYSPTEFKYNDACDIATRARVSELFKPGLRAIISAEAATSTPPLTPLYGSQTNLSGYSCASSSMYLPYDWSPPCSYQRQSASDSPRHL